MAKLVLYVGNKNYSSWSLRPWLALTAGGIPFEDVVVPFDFAAGNPRFHEISPTGRVPVLHHGEIRIWESLAIIEYVAELFPDAVSGRRTARIVPVRAATPWRCSPASGRCAAPAR